MNTKINFRVRVMSYAHHIFFFFFISWSDALKKAWQLYRLAKKMRSGVVKFFYEKVDGSARVAYGTLCNLPPASPRREEQRSRTTALCATGTPKSRRSAVSELRTLSRWQYEKGGYTNQGGRYYARYLSVKWKRLLAQGTSRFCARVDRDCHPYE